MDQRRRHHGEDEGDGGPMDDSGESAGQQRNFQREADQVDRDAQERFKDISRKYSRRDVQNVGAQ